MVHQLVQYLVLLTTAIAVCFMMKETFTARQIGCAVGLAGQLLWLGVTFTPERWGEFGAQLIYTGFWFGGFVRYWLGPRIAASSWL